MFGHATAVLECIGAAMATSAKRPSSQMAKNCHSRYVSRNPTVLFSTAGHWAADEFNFEDLMECSHNHLAHT